MSYLLLLPLVKKTGCTLSAEEFHSIINVVFHNFEADHYDTIHDDMKESLQEQIDLLINDLFTKSTAIPSNLSLLDVGCGTGLSTQILLQSQLGSHIEKICLLDTSPNMLRYAEEKAKKWGKKYQLINSDISKVNEKFDIVIICSVLHHIPDLSSFLIKIDSLLNENGILIHLQDPNGDHLGDDDYQERVALYNKELTTKSNTFNLKKLFPKKWKHFINRKIGKKTYIDLVNDKLIAEKVIKKRMTADELWSVTDIHVETKDSYENKGISLHFLRKELQNFTLLNQRSYGFYGHLKSDLHSDFKDKEAAFINKNELSGRNLSCIWMKKADLN